MVGETGFAPARACAHEFLRLACIHSTTRRKRGAAGATCTPTRHDGAAVFKTARSAVPHTAANGRGGRICTGTGSDAQRGLSPPCLRSNHAAKTGADRGSCTPMGFSPPAPRAGASPVSPCPHKMEHPQGRAPCSLPYQGSPSLSTGWMPDGRDGRIGSRPSRSARCAPPAAARSRCCAPAPS